MDILGTLQTLLAESGFAGFFADGGWKNLIMIGVACVLLYLGIVKKFEPLLLVGIAFGCLLTNIPGAGLYHPELWDQLIAGEIGYGHILKYGGLLDILYIGVKTGVYPSLIFMGVGAMTDFGPLLAYPKSLMLGAAVKKGDILVVLEAMKMENEILAPKDGTVAQIAVTKGATVDTGALLAVIA